MKSKILGVCEVRAVTARLPCTFTLFIHMYVSFAHAEVLRWSG
jgi:hypothetical protein